MTVAGAADWIVVNVVVRERTEGVGEEKVLPSPPKPWELRAPPFVVAVPAFDWAASECVVSAFVETVGAADLELAEKCWSSLETGREPLLWAAESVSPAFSDGGVANDRWPPLDADSACRVPFVLDWG